MIKTSHGVEKTPNNMANEQKQLSINIAQDKAQGVFANLALIAHTPTEFVLDFAQLMPGIQQANVVARVVVTPDQAKKILGALQNNIGGPVHGSTLPLTFTGGEA